MLRLRPAPDGAGLRSASTSSSLSDLGVEDLSLSNGLIFNIPTPAPPSLSARKGTIARGAQTIITLDKSQN